jgi:hypothetical protein
MLESILDAKSVLLRASEHLKISSTPPEVEPMIHYVHVWNQSGFVKITVAP